MEPTPPGTALTLPTKEERNVAMIGHALSFIEGGVVGPLILYFLRKEALGLFSGKGASAGEDSAFVAFHTLQSLYFGLIFAVISLPVAVVTCGWGLFITVPIYFIFQLIAAIRANDGEWYRLPLAGDWAARQHPPPMGSI